MLYLAKTKQGIFLVDSAHWQGVCADLRVAGVCGQDELPFMITGFAPPVRGVQKAMISFTSVDSNLLTKAILEYAQCCINDSWSGGGDPESIPEIEQELAAAKKVLEEKLGVELKC